MSVLAFLTTNSALHRNSIYAVDTFIYTRTIIYLLSHSPMNPSTVYAIAVFLGAALSLASGNYKDSAPTIALIYSLLTLALYVFEERNTVACQRSDRLRILRIPGAWEKLRAEVVETTEIGKEDAANSLTSLITKPTDPNHPSPSSSSGETAAVLATPWRLQAAEIGFTSLETYNALQQVSDEPGEEEDEYREPKP